MKTALITGSSRGIGSQIALDLAKEGYNIIINYFKSEEKAIQLQKQILSIGVDCLAIKADVSKENEVVSMVENACAHFGRIDVLVNNAGISKKNLLIDESSIDEFNMININLLGTILCSKYCIKNMISNDNVCHIINLSSMWGKVGASCEATYSATKGGVIAFTKSLAKEYAGRILVNAICPGVIDTDMNANLSAKDKQNLINDIPAGRIGNVKDISDIVNFLVSEKANYITGQIITVDGGFTL